MARSDDILLPATMFVPLNQPRKSQGKMAEVSRSLRQEADAEAARQIGTKVPAQAALGANKEADRMSAESTSSDDSLMPSTDGKSSA